MSYPGSTLVNSHHSISCNSVYGIWGYCGSILINHCTTIWKVKNHMMMANPIVALIILLSRTITGMFSMISIVSAESLSISYSLSLFLQIIWIFAFFFLFIKYYMLFYIYHHSFGRNCYFVLFHYSLISRLTYGRFTLLYFWAHSSNLS